MKRKKSTLDQDKIARILESTCEPLCGDGVQQFVRRSKSPAEQTVEEQLVSACLHALVVAPHESGCIFHAHETKDGPCDCFRQRLYDAAQRAKAEKATGK